MGLRIPVAPRPGGGVRHPSWIAVERVTSVRRDRARLTGGRLAPEELAALDRALAAFLGLR